MLLLVMAFSHSSRDPNQDHQEHACFGGHLGFSILSKAFKHFAWG